MRIIVVIALALGTLAGSCTRHKDPETPTGWRRPFQARLSGAGVWQPCRALPSGPDQAVQRFSCGTVPAATASGEACDEEINTHAQAVNVLLSQPACLDTVIEALQRFAVADAGALNDLSVAYQERAQRQDDATDLARALQAAQGAVAAAPNLPAARFNVALTQEAVGLTGEAIRSWKRFTDTDPNWRSEARAHLAHLEKQLAAGGVASWERNRGLLEDALRSGNGAAALPLLAPFPDTAPVYFEETLLPRWAETPSAENLATLKNFAVQWTRLTPASTRDPYLLDIVKAIEQSANAPVRRAALQKGHRVLAQARVAGNSFGDPLADYRIAATALQEGGSPLALNAKLGIATQVSIRARDGDAQASALLLPLEEEARRLGYRHLLARIQSTQALFLARQSRYVKSMAYYDAALAAYTSLNDPEGLASTHIRRIGVLRAAGLVDAAWREALQTLRSASKIVRRNDVHLLLTETSGALAALGMPELGLLYEDAAVQRFRTELKAAPPDDLVLIRELRTNVGIALRNRATIELQLRRTADAAADLAEAGRLTDEGRKQTDTDIIRILEARLQEVQGSQRLLDGNAADAVAAYTKALAAADASSTYRAELLVHRAEAYRHANDAVRAEADLRDALEVLRGEETRILAGRKRGQAENLWYRYFSRFQEPYQLLIRQLIEQGDDAGAFAYSERARTFEVLDLVLQLDPLPRSVRELARKRASMSLAEIRSRLPTGVFLIEYTVLADRTYAWVISKEGFERLTLQATSGAIERWSNDLQRAAHRNDPSTFNRALFAAYASLVAAPLETIRRMPHGDSADRQLVFVPDGVMNGLPFPALRDASTGRYLIQDAIVSTAGSATLYSVSRDLDRALPVADVPEILLIGNPEFDRSSALTRELNPLPGARREVEEIRDLYTPNAQILTDADATVERFLALSLKKTVIHIAAHTIVNAREPFRSLILLAKSPDDSGVLSAQELLTRLKLDQTRLVVLSTCSSAGGLPVGSEGVAPLVRPIIAAGVPGVVGTLWDVNDATVWPLLVSFHRHYRKGSTAAVALRAAQLELIDGNKSGLGPVPAWTAFLVIGYASSPYGQRQRHKGEPP